METQQFPSKNGIGYNGLFKVASSINKLETLLTELANSEFVFTEATVENAVRKKGMFQLFDSVESLKLDVYPREMIEGELSRSQEVEIFESVFLPIASRFDAAISKLIWVSKGSHKSRRDFRQICIRSSEAEINEVHSNLMSLLAGVMTPA